MLVTLMNDKQFIVGFSFGLVCSVVLALWKRSVSCQNTLEKCVTREKKKVSFELLSITYTLILLYSVLNPARKASFFVLVTR